MSEEAKPVLYERRGRVIWITLNRPDKRNALSDEMLTQLTECLARADAESDAGCIVLTGAGDKAFCAGADLSAFSGGDGVLAQYESKGRFPQVFMAIEQMSKPVLAAVNGHCVAGGFGLMMACDLAIAKSGFKMGTPEIARGLFPFMISALILRNIPRRRAFEIMFSGELFPSEQAEAWDIVNRVVDPDDFDHTVEEWSNRIAAYSPAVLKLGKQALNQQADMPLPAALAHLQGMLSVNTMMEDAAEGIAAFFEKRAPKWKGR